MNLRDLGWFFVGLGLILGGVGFFHSFPDRAEKDAQSIADAVEVMEKRNAEGRRQLQLMGEKFAQDAPPPDTQLRDKWTAQRQARERVMYVSFSVGGILLVTGLICAASQKSKPA